jgi:hypothetical protein
MFYVANPCIYNRFAVDKRNRSFILRHLLELSRTREVTEVIHIHSVSDRDKAAADFAKLGCVVTKIEMAPTSWLPPIILQDAGSVRRRIRNKKTVHILVGWLMVCSHSIVLARAERVP